MATTPGQDGGSPDLTVLDQELEAIFESSYDGIYVTDGNGTTLRANQAFVRLDGVDPAEYVGRSVAELEAAGAFSPSATREVLRRRERVTMVQMTRAGRRVLVTGNPIFDAEGRLVRVVSNVRDLTELMDMEERLAQQERLLERYQTELEESRRAAVQIPGLVLRDARMQELVRLARRVAGVDSTVLILGESGVGKDVFARYIHGASRRAGGPFISLNCGALPPSLLEAELFGYEKGAFTGALSSGRPGLVELAHVGTLFLNEVAELPPDLQVKLLELIQHKQFLRIGGRKPTAVDFRLISATNRDLEVMLQHGTLRQDLYYRLNVVTLTLPPLRERSDDILPLAAHFLQAFNERYGMARRFSPGALRALLSHAWPGNVRELENTVERVVVTAADDLILADDLPPALQAETAPAAGPAAPSRPAASPMAAVVHMVSEARSLPLVLEEIEAEIIRRAQREHGSSYRVARALGISQSAAVRKLRRYCSPGTSGGGAP